MTVIRKNTIPLSADVEKPHWTNLGMLRFYSFPAIFLEAKNLKHYLCSFLLPMEKKKSETELKILIQEI